jgi:hypothetical protein
LVDDRARSGEEVMKTVLSMLAVGTALIAAPAMAQVTGTVDITGSVAPKCLVIPGQGPVGATFGGLIPLGELADGTGKLRADVATTFNAAGNAGALTARVVCTTAAPTISVNADAITSVNTPAPAANSGYDNSIDFNASVAVQTTTGAAGPFENDSKLVPAGLPDTAIGGRLANNGSTNIAITGSNFRTDTLQDLLVADTQYTGKIVVVIKPGA